MSLRATRLVKATAAPAAVLLVASGCSLGGGSERPTTVTQTVEAPPPSGSPQPGPGSPSAEDPTRAGPRLEGAWAVSGTVRRFDNYRDTEVGDTTSTRWRFEPLCGQGACDVRLLREEDASGPREVVLQQRGRFLSGNHRYSATGICGDGARIFKGYKMRDRITLEVTESDPSGRATAFRGRRVSRSTPDYDRSSDGPCTLPPSSVEQSLEGTVR